MEEWKDIEGYEGLYQVSDQGNVKSLARKRNNSKGSYTQKERILKQSNTTTGYKKVELVKNGQKKSLRVHRLVAQAFIPNPENKPEVNHIDGNKTNNFVSNLEWVTSSENTTHAYTAKLSSQKRDLDEDEIVFMYCDLNMTMQQIAQHFNISIHSIKKRLEDNNVEIKTLSEQKNKFRLEDIDLEEELKTKSQAQLARELGCSQSLISKKLHNKY